MSYTKSIGRVGTENERVRVSILFRSHKKIERRKSGNSKDSPILHVPAPYTAPVEIHGANPIPTTVHFGAIHQSQELIIYFHR